MSSHSNSGGTTTKIKPKVTEKNLVRKNTNNNSNQTNKIVCDVYELVKDDLSCITYGLYLIHIRLQSRVHSLCSAQTARYQGERQEQNKTKKGKK